MALISSDFSFGLNNFDLIRETDTSTTVLDKIRTLSDFGFKEKVKSIDFVIYSLSNS